MYKYRNATLPENSNSTVLTPLQLSWNSYLSISSMVPNVLFLFINAFFGHKFKYEPRLLFAMISVTILFIFSDVMTKVNTDDWQYQFLGITLFTVVLNGTMTAIFQVST